MKKANPCPICANTATLVYEIPKISTQHGGYNIAKNGSHWICGDCLVNVFNDTFLQGKPPIKSADLAYEFISTDLMILSTLYSEVSDIVATNGVAPEEASEEKEEEKKEGAGNVLGFGKANKIKSNRDGIIKKTPNGKNYDTGAKLLMPKEIEAQLRKTVVGQDKLIKDLSIAAYKYLQSLTNSQIKRSNILIMGQSGTGKTESIKALAKVLERPMLAINSAMLTPTGYRGENLNSVAEKLISLYGYERAKNAILYFDEFDKLVDPDGHSETSEFKKAVLPELYKILDGDPMVATSHRGETISIETKGMLIIMTGAFQKMEDRKNRARAARSVGLSGNHQVQEQKPFSFAEVTRSDLIDYGFPVELVGRFSIRSYTVKFEREDYLNILKTSSASILKEYNQVFKAMGSEVDFTDEFLLSIVDRALSERTGARTMYSLIEERILNELYDVDFMIRKKVVIKKDSTDILALEEPSGEATIQ